MQHLIFRNSFRPNVTFLHERCNVRCKISGVAAFLYFKLQKALEVCPNKETNNTVMCARLYCVLGTKLKVTKFHKLLFIIKYKSRSFLPK
jgi:hypothetical protein